MIIHNHLNPNQMINPTLALILCSLDKHKICGWRGGASRYNLFSKFSPKISDLWRSRLTNRSPEKGVVLCDDVIPGATYKCDASQALQAQVTENQRHHLNWHTLHQHAIPNKYSFYYFLSSPLHTSRLPALLGSKSKQEVMSRATLSRLDKRM